MPTGSGQTPNKDDEVNPDESIQHEQTDQAPREEQQSFSGRTFHLTVAYDGSNYCGWQVQPDQVSVQAEIENVVRPLAGKPVRVLGSGRTDAGVHAVGQVARCQLSNWSAGPDALMRAINSKLPDDIRVREVRETRERFHPIADAIGKQYQYLVQVGGGRDPFFHRYVHRVPGPLDHDKMQAAAEKFVGRHDFRAFQGTGAERPSTVRTIDSAKWLAREISGPTGVPLEGEHWCFQIEGEGFLYNMVRNLIGTMLEVGRGKQSLDWIDHVLDSRDRKQAGPTAPPQGLYLCRVDYPDEIFVLD
ncbi:tRNA pseudouridine(38-40) synthase TruA [Rhodopirellula sp. JC740]|uniref:tRNA pseudouridine synthase A n=1 Tax=Rhodopirellula halodulae TaxID=2894198 RepID=A0ABS8NMU6_9BACT|nr:tRNA pseudouridine(38-40) synthase TruA [Rhodopirellula sp. JC740]MCC9644907.1 tRNA pseudouridine(38-40) synthase TruA [Rhodopirellula sp. JC740]